jgi:hypothetical protein
MSQANMEMEKAALDALIIELRTAAKGAKKDKSWQGYSAIVRQERMARESRTLLLDRMEAIEGDLSEGELLTEFRMAAAAMPLSHLEVFVHEYDGRTGGGRLRVIEGGNGS